MIYFFSRTIKVKTRLMDEFMNESSYNLIIIINEIKSCGLDFLMVMMIDCNAGSASYKFLITIGPFKSHLNTPGAGA